MHAIILGWGKIYTWVEICLTHGHGKAKMENLSSQRHLEYSTRKKTRGFKLWSSHFALPQAICNLWRGLLPNQKIVDHKSCMAWKTMIGINCYRYDSSLFYIVVMKKHLDNKISLKYIVFNRSYFLLQPVGLAVQWSMKPFTRWENLSGTHPSINILNLVCNVL